MATHYIPRNVKGEGRILLIFSTKSLITTGIGASVGFLFYLIFKACAITWLGIIFLALFAGIGYAIGSIKIPVITGIRFTKNVAGDYIDSVIIRYIKFMMNKKIYTYVDTKEENVNE